MKTATRPLRADIGYHQAHERLKNARGVARQYQCVDCGGQAREWSWGHRGRPIQAWTGKDGCGSLVWFSADPADYDPRCRDCHAAFDAFERRRARAERARAANVAQDAARAVA